MLHWDSPTTALNLMLSRARSRRASPTLGIGMSAGGGPEIGDAAADLTWPDFPQDLQSLVNEQSSFDNLFPHTWSFSDGASHL